jgi:hypothetical protein
MPAPAGWHFDLNSPFREPLGLVLGVERPQGLSTLRNSDQIDSVGSVRGKKALLGVVVNLCRLVEIRGCLEWPKNRDKNHAHADDDHTQGNAEFEVVGKTITAGTVNKEIGLISQR